MAAPGFAPALHALGLAAPGGLARCLAAGRGPEGRARVAVLPLPGRPEQLCLRPVRHGGLLGPLLRGALRGLRRPLRELAVTEALREAGAPVPRAVCVVGERVAAGVSQAAMGTVFEEEAQDGVAFLAGARPDQARAAAAAVGRAMRRFHDAGGRHRDLHVKNVLLRPGPGGLEALVVDLDRAGAGAPPGPRRRMAELMRMQRSLLKRGLVARLGRRGIAAGFGAYVGGDRRLRAALLRHLARERLRLAVHELHYRRR